MQELCLECGELYSSWFSRHDSSKTTMDRFEINGTKAINLAFIQFPESTLLRIFGRTKQPQVADSELTLRGSTATSNIATSAAEEKNSRDGSTNVSLVKIDGGETGGREDESTMAVSMYYNPLYESVYNAEENGDSESKIAWKWLSTVPLDILLAVGAKVIGIDALMEIVQKLIPEDGVVISGEFYRFISDGTVLSINDKV